MESSLPAVPEIKNRLGRGDHAGNGGRIDAQAAERRGERAARRQSAFSKLHEFAFDALSLVARAADFGHQSPVRLISLVIGHTDRSRSDQPDGRPHDQLPQIRHSLAKTLDVTPARPRAGRLAE